MPKYKKTFTVNSREVEFDVDNEMPAIFSEMAIKGCLQVIEGHWVFKYFPKLKINLNEKFGLTLQGINLILKIHAVQMSANVNIKNIRKIRRFPEITINLDVIAIPIIQQLNSQKNDVVLNQFIDGQINSYCAELYVKKLQTDLIHEGTHLWHILQSDFFKVRRALDKKIKLSLKEYGLAKNEEQIEFIKLLRDKKVDPYGLAGKQCLDLWKNMRKMLKAFIDMIFAEGLAKYVEDKEGYVFQSEKLTESYEQASPYINMFKRKFETLIKFTEEGVKVEIEDRNVGSEKVYHVFEKNIPEIIEKMQVIPYSVGPHMVYVILYKNGPFFIEKLVKMNVFNFVKEYENSCKHFGLTPLVSLYSGNGVFDYKRALIQWQTCSKFIRKIR